MPGALQMLINGSLFLLSIIRCKTCQHTFVSGENETRFEKPKEDQQKKAQEVPTAKIVDQLYGLNGEFPFPPKQPEGEPHYPCLRLLGIVYKITGLLVLIAGLIGGLVLSGKQPSGSMAAPLILVTTWVGSFVVAVTQWAMAELIELGMRIEKNTRK